MIKYYIRIHVRLNITQYFRFKAFKFVLWYIYLLCIIKPIRTHKKPL
nr:MAG TPA: hypothetical protein [Ackermannviridae sp.]